MRELVVGRLTKVWGGSSTGRASVLQAEGCGFKSRPLHGAARGSVQGPLCGTPYFVKFLVLGESHD